MKATGIVRRIDELGRIVVPKGDPARVTDSGRRSIGNIYRQGW